MTDIAELALKVDARQVKDANAELNRMSGASKKVDRDVDQFATNTNTRLASITRSLGVVAAGFVSLSAGRSLIDATIQLDKFNNALKVATGSTQGAAREMAFVRKESERLGLNLQTTAEQYSRLAAAAKGTALQGQATRNIFTSVAQAATVLGLSADETGGALTALEQIISKGKVSAEELRGQLGERLPGAFQIAARSIGVTTAELDKMLSTGQLTAEQLLPALAAELDKTFGPEAEQAAQQLNAQINRFNTAMFNLKIAIGELGLIELFNAGIKVVTSFVNLVNAHLIPAIKSIGEFINSIPVVSDVIKAAFGGGVLSSLKNMNSETESLNTELEKTEVIARKVNIEAPVAKAEVATKKLNKALQEQRREAERTADEITRLTREYDPLFKRNEELARLIELRAQGLPESIFNAAAAKAINDYMAATQQIEESVDTTETAHKRLGVTARNVFDDTSQYAIQAARNIQTSLANALAGSFNDFKDFGKNILGVFTNLAAQIASSNILRGLGVGGLVGGSSAAFAAGGGGGFGAIGSIGNILSSGFGISNLVGSGISGFGSLIGSGSLTAFGQAFTGDAIAGFAGQAGAFGASAGSAFSAVAGPAMIAAVADIGLRSIFGDKKLGGTAGDVLSYVPVVGTLINGLFGRSAPKFSNDDLIGQFTAGGFEGAFNRQYNEKGGLFKSTRTSNFIFDTSTGEQLNQFGRLSESGNIPGKLRDAVTDQAAQQAVEIGKLLNESIKAISTSAESAAKKLGISTKSLDDFSFAVDLVTEKGQQISEADIAGVIGDASESLVEHLIPSIDSLAKHGESSIDALVRLGNEFAVLENALVISGRSAEVAEEKIRSLSFDDRSDLVDSFGGVEQLQGELNSFFENVLNESQKLHVVEEQIRAVLKPLGIDFIPTAEQLFEAFESGNPELIKAAFAVDELVLSADALREAGTDADSIIKKFKESVEGAVSPTDQLLGKIDDLGIAGIDTAQDIYDAVQTMGESAGLTTNQFDSLVDALGATDGAVDDVIKTVEELAELAAKTRDADRRDFVDNRRFAQEKEAERYQTEIDRMVEARFMRLQELANSFSRFSAARELSFLDNGSVNPDQFTNILRNDSRVDELASSDFGFDVREFFDLGSIKAKFGHLLKNNAAGIFDILKDAVIDGFKAQFGSGADQIRELTAQFESGTGQFSPDPAELENIARERYNLETQLLQLQGDTVALRQRELDAVDESNRPLLERIHNLQDEQAEQQRLAAIAQERGELEKQLMQLQGDTAGLRQLELDALDESNRSLLERIFSIQDENVALEKQKQIADERFGLESRLLELQGNTAALRSRELDALDESNRELLERVFALQDEASILEERRGLETRLLEIQGDTQALRQLELNALDESNRSLLERIFALQDAAVAEEELARKQEARINDSFSALQRAVDAEKNQLAAEYNRQIERTRDHIDSVSNSLGKLTELSNLLKQGIETLNPLSQQSARGQIEAAIQGARNGIFPDASSLTQAVNTLTNLGTDNFSSREDFLIAQAENSNLLKELNGLTEAEKTLDERSLDALNAQAERLEDGFNAEIGRLDGILDSARTQIDILNGIDVSIKSVADALAGFNAASRDAGGSGIGDFSDFGAGGIGNSIQRIGGVSRDYIGLSSDSAIQANLDSLRRRTKNIDGTDFAIKNFGYENDQGKVVGVRFGGTHLGGSIKADFQTGVLSLKDGSDNVIFQQVYDDLAELDRLSLLGALGLSKELGVPKFGSGGIHHGGLRIVGENGPELEYTGPSKITSNKDVREIFDNKNVVKAIEKLIEKVTKSTESNERLRKMIRDSYVETDEGLAQRTSAA